MKYPFVRPTSSVDVRDATHVKVADKVEKIVSKWGISKEGRLAKPSEGGFGVITESGRRVTMMEAQAYYREDPLPQALTADELREKVESMASPDQLPYLREVFRRWHSYSEHLNKPH